MVLMPLVDAGWHSDDWAWLAAAVHSGPPYSAFFENHLFGFYYRPISVFAWWLATAAFGIDSSGHYLVAMALHALGALCAGEFVRASTGSLRRGAVAAVLVAVAPPVVGMSLWLSNRSEALVLVFGFLAMRLAIMGTGSAPRAAAVGMLLWLAMASKETGFAFVPAVAFLMVAESGWRSLLLPIRFTALVLPLLLALLPRPFVTISLPGAASPMDLPGVAVGGLHFWVHRLPDALGGWGETGALPLAIASLALALAFAGAIALLRHGRRWDGLALLTLLFFAALAQSPNTSGAVGDAAVMQFLVNLRYFAVGSAALAALAACAIPRHASSPRHMFVVALSMALAFAWALQSHAQAKRWAVETRLQTAQMLEAMEVGDLDSLCPPPFGAGEFPVGLRAYADLLYKARLPSGDPRLSCLVSLDGDPVGIVLLPRSACADVPTPHDWQVLVRDGRRFAEPFGRLCQVAYQRAALGVTSSSE